MKRLTAFAVAAILFVSLLSGCTAGNKEPSPGPVTSASAPSTAPESDAAPNTVTTSSTTPGPAAPESTRPTDEASSGEDRLPGPTRMYTDPDYGFSLAYPESWKVTVVARAEGGPGGSSVKDVGAFDPTGSSVDGVLLDGLAVSVFPLSVVVNADLLPAFEAEIEDLVAGLRGRLSAVEVVEPLRATTVNNVPGFETTHTFSYKGRRVRSRVVFLAAESIEYQLTAQAVESSWDVSGPALDLLVESFSPGR
ncbi:MAG: hypothetical protein ACYC5Q_05410 [Thermoleophilia bacterium]